MEIIEEGEGELIGWHDPDENRKWVKENKPRTLIDKTIDSREAVKKFIRDGDYVVSGGFGHIRVSMPIIYEMIRQHKKKLVIGGKTAVHDCDVLIAAGCVEKVEVAYAFGYEMRGLAPASRRAVESGKCRVVSEISNAAYQWRFLAGMMGVPFVTSRNMMGTDTFKKSSAKIARDPYSGKPVTLIPAAYPDVALIHVHRCDKYGNSQIDGIVIEDYELARAARRLIITTEEIISEDKIRCEPHRTQIPFYCVDAVVEAPYGSHPCLMPYKYFFDEEHIGEWLSISKTDEGVQKYMDKYIYGAETFEDYLKLIGGQEKLDYLKDVENMKAPLRAPWIK